MFCGAFGYADDVILLSPTLYSLRRILDICQVFADEYDVLFNSAKSKFLFFSKAVDRPVVCPIYFMGDIIELVSHEKHLGNIIGQNCDKYQIQSSINDFFSKVNMVSSHFKNVQFDVLYKLFKTYCMPLYGSQLWDHSNKYIDKFYVSWRKALRKCLHLPYMTHCDLLPYICDDYQPSVQLYLRIISLCKSLNNSTNIISRLCYSLASNGSGSALGNNISLISSFWAVPRTDICQISRSFIIIIFIRTKWSTDCLVHYNVSADEKLMQLITG